MTKDPQDLKAQEGEKPSRELYECDCVEWHQFGGGASNTVGSCPYCWEPLKPLSQGERKEGVKTAEEIFEEHHETFTGNGDYCFEYLSKEAFVKAVEQYSNQFKHGNK